MRASLSTVQSARAAVALPETIKAAHELPIAILRRHLDFSIIQDISSGHAPPAALLTPLTRATMSSWAE
jgi:hypothetical protein